jgi:GH25 family lysozyme M1 (1,4-beta-N-acetylmuramidase)
MTVRPLVVDISHYQKTMNFPLLKEKGVEAVIVKAGGSGREDTECRKHSAGVLSAGMFLGLYYWVDPLQNGQMQAEHMASIASSVGAHFLAGDVEQWWASWALWQQMILKKIPQSQVPKISPSLINGVSYSYFREVAKRSSLKQLFYSSTGFISSYAPQLLSWSNDYDNWLAQYHQTNGTLKRASLSWEQLKALYLPKSTPSVLAKMRRPSMWQWSGDRFTLPGHQGLIDLNWWMLDDVSLDAWIGEEQPQPSPLPYDVYRLNSSTNGLNVRSGPSASHKILRVIVRATPPIQICMTSERSGSWGKLYGEEAWLHMGYVEKV